MPMRSINKNKMEQPDEHALILIKFEPNEVLFQQRDTRRVYRYFNLRASTASLPPPSIEGCLLRGTLFNGGVLYPKEDSDLSLEIQQRRRSFKGEHFSEEEIANTFIPLFGLLRQIHNKGLTHGSVSLQDIVIVEGEVMLRDWLLGEGKQVTPEEDLLAMGQCMLACAFLSLEGKKADWDKQLHSSIQKYSRAFTIALLIVAKELKEYYRHVINILEGDTNLIDSKLSALYEAMKPQPASKAHALKTSPKNSEIKQGLALSPMKKGVHKKAGHHENIENKQGQGRRGKQSGSMQELMSKKLNEEEKKLKEQVAKRGKEKAVINVSNFGVQNNSRKLQKDSHSPLHKLRPYSRRK